MSGLAVPLFETKIVGRKRDILKEIMFFFVMLTFLLPMIGAPMVFSVISPLLYFSVVYLSWTMWPELESVCTHKALLCFAVEDTMMCSEERERGEGRPAFS